MDRLSFLWINRNLNAFYPTKLYLKRISFVIRADKSNFTHMKIKSKIIKFVLTFGSAFVIFMVFMVISRFI